MKHRIGIILFFALAFTALSTGMAKAQETSGTCGTNLVWILMGIPVA